MTIGNHRPKASVSCVNLLSCAAPCSYLPNSIGAIFVFPSFIHYELRNPETSIGAGDVHRSIVIAVNTTDVSTLMLSIKSVHKSCFYAVITTMSVSIC